MVTIKEVPPAKPRFWVEKDGLTVGHIDRIGGKFQYSPTVLHSSNLTSLEMQDIVKYLEELNDGNS